MGVSFSEHGVRVALVRENPSAVTLSPRTPFDATLRTLFDLTMPTPTPKAFASTTVSSQSVQPFDVLGLGEAMIDFSVCVSDAALQEFRVEKGGRRIVSFEERVKIVRQLEESYVLTAGSSVANTLVALSQLSHAEGNRLRLGFAGCVGSDREGKFYSADLKSNHVDVLECASKENQERLTGCVIVLITPDAQRSFLVCPGEGRLHLRHHIEHKIASAKILLIEGYLFGMPEALDVIKRAVSLAKQNGTLVAVTAGAADVVKNCLAAFWEIIEMGVDIFLCNQVEAAALLEEDDQYCAYKSIKHLYNYFPLVAVTDGSKGSYIAAMQQLQTIPPFWRKHAPVDTCGAGDVYAAGVLLAYLRRYDLRTMGLMASRSASAIIAKQGAQLSEGDAIKILADISKHKSVEALNAFCD